METPPLRANQELIWYSARSRYALVDPSELWRYRQLVVILALRDIKVRYRQTIIGLAWALLQPLTQLLIFSVLFGLLGRSPVAANVPFLVSAMCGLVLWQLFSQAVAGASLSLADNQSLVTKVYFPRLVLPLSAVVAVLVDFAVACGLLAVIMVWYGMPPAAPVLLAPLFTVLTLLVAAAISVWLSALTVLYRDFRYVIPFLLQVAFFVSPVIYQTDVLIPDSWRPLFALNPLAGAIDGFRWSVTGQGAFPFLTVGVSLPLLLALLVTGLFYFRHVERTFADRI